MNHEYSAEETAFLRTYVMAECGGVFSLEDARQMGVELNRKTTSVIAKARSLGLVYIPRTSGPQIGAPPAEPFHQDDAGTSPGDWSEQLNALGERWETIGMSSHWQIRRADLKRHLRSDSASVFCRSLFSDQEVQDVREQRIRELEAEVTGKLSKKISVLSRFLGSRTTELEALEKQYARDGRSDEFLAALETMAKQRQEILSAEAEALFDDDDIAARRFRYLAPVRHEILCTETALLERFEQYHHLTQTFAPNPLDDHIDSLADEFSAIGRQRIWWHEFNQLVASVLQEREQSSQQHIETNARLQQNAFVLIVSERRQLYSELYARCQPVIANGEDVIVERISFFESALQGMLSEGASSDQCDRVVTDFIQSLTKVGAMRTRRLRLSNPVERPISVAEREERMLAWRHFSERQVETRADVVDCFRELKSFIKLTPQWRQCYRDFSEQLAATADSDRDRIGEIRRFIEETKARINKEMPVELALLRLEQDSRRAAQYGEQLAVLKNLMAVQLKRSDMAGWDELTRLKAEFVGSLERNGNVVPFSAARR